MKWNVFDSDGKDIIQIPRGIKCFLNLEQFVPKKEPQLREEDDEFWEMDLHDPSNLDPFWDVDLIDPTMPPFDELEPIEEPTPPLPPTLPEKTATFLAELGWNNLYSTPELVTLCNELIAIMDHLAICDSELVLVPVVLARETQLSPLFERLFNILTFQDRLDLLTFLLEEMGTPSRAKVEHFAEKLLKILASVHLFAQFKRLQQAQTWDEINHLYGLDCQVARELEIWTDQGMDLLLFFQQHGFLTEFEEKLGALCLLPQGILRGTFATLPEEDALVEVFLTFVVQCETEFVQRLPPAWGNDLYGKPVKRDQALFQFVLCADLVQYFVDKTSLSEATMGRLAVLLVTRFNAIFSMFSLQRHQLYWNKILAPKHLNSLGEPEFVIFPDSEYLVLTPSGHCLIYDYPYDLTKRQTGMAALPLAELTADPKEFRIIFKFTPNWNWISNCLGFFTILLPGRVVVDHLQWVRWGTSPRSQLVWEKRLNLLQNRNVELHLISTDANRDRCQPTWNRILMRLRTDESTELVFTDPDGTIHTLRVDPGFEKYLAQTIMDDWFPESSFRIIELLSLLRKGFAVQGWVVRYRPEDHRFFMHKYGVRVPIIGGLQLANLLIGCFPRKEFAKYVQREVENFKTPVWFAIGPWCFQFDPSMEPSFIVTLHWNLAAVTWDERPPLTQTMYVTITQQEFFQAAEVWEELEVNNLEEDFLQGEWQAWLCKFYPPQDILEIFTPGPAQFFQIWTCYQFFRRNVRGNDRHRRAKLEFDLMMKKLAPGECWFPTDIFCKLIGEDETCYVIERINLKRSTQKRSYRVKVPKKAVQQLETLLQAYPTRVFIAKQVQEMFNWTMGPLDVVRVLVCLRKATLDDPAPTNALQFRFQPEMDPVTTC